MSQQNTWTRLPKRILQEETRYITSALGTDYCGIRPQDIPVYGMSHERPDLFTA